MYQYFEYGSCIVHLEPQISTSDNLLHAPCTKLVDQLHFTLYKILKFSLYVKSKSKILKKKTPPLKATDSDVFMISHCIISNNCNTSYIGLYIYTVKKKYIFMISHCIISNNCNTSYIALYIYTVKKNYRKIGPWFLLVRRGI